MITLFLGPMYASKTTTMISKLERAYLAKKRICLIRPFIDNRDFLTHGNIVYEFLKDKETIRKELFNFNISSYDVIGIDEGQFFVSDENDLANFCIRASDDKKDVYISALQASSECEMFPSIIKLIPHCDKIIKFNAICSDCGSEYGSYTKYVGDSKKDSILVGGKENYKSVCRKCYFKEI